MMLSGGDVQKYLCALIMSKRLVGRVLGVVRRHVVHGDGRPGVHTIWASNTFVGVGSLFGSNATSVIAVAVWRAARAAADAEEPEESTSKREEGS